MVATGSKTGKRYDQQKKTWNIWKRRNERPTARNVSFRSRNGAAPRKGRVVNGQVSKASNKRVRPPHSLPTSFPLLPPPLPPPYPLPPSRCSNMMCRNRYARK